jgi:hypothetical protein
MAGLLGMVVRGVLGFFLLKFAHRDAPPASPPGGHGGTGEPVARAQAGPAPRSPIGHVTPTPPVDASPSASMPRRSRPSFGDLGR